MFEHLGRSNGLPNSLVQDEAEDGDGFLWVGTPSGLARWDGYRFRSYAVGNDASKSSDNYIQCVHADSRGRVWAGLNSGGLAGYDRGLDRFAIVPLDPAYPDRVVHAVADDGAGGLWVGTEDGLDHLPFGATSARHVAGFSGGSQRVMRLLLARDGGLWVGTAAGLYHLDRNSSDFVLVSMQALDISALFEDQEGRVWIGTMAQGPFVLPKGANTLVPVRDKRAGGLPIEDWRISTILEVSPGQIWLGTLGDGIVSLDVKTGWMARLRHEPAQSTSLQNDDVWALFRDRSGQVWVGSTIGLDRYDPSHGAISTLFGGGMDGGLSKSDAWSVLQIDEQHILLGLSDLDIDVVNLAEGRISHLPLREGNHHLPHAAIRSMARAPNGDVFAATIQGLFRIDRVGRISRVAVSSGRPEMAVDVLLALGGSLWIGTRNDGLWKLDFGSHEGGLRIGRSGLTNDRVLALAEGPDGLLWVGTRNGLNLVNPVTEQTEQILSDAQDPESLTPGMISSLLTDRQGRLWISTEGGGVNLLKYRDADGRPRFRRFGTTEGLPHDNVNKLLMGRAGEIWASTDDGLASIDPDSFAIRAFGRAEGVAISTYWINGGGATERGDILFGGVGGLSVVHPDRISRWSYIPPIVVTDLHVGGNAIPPGRFSVVSSKHPMVVQPDANSLSVEFAALDFSAPERSRYAYKLVGFDTDWVKTDSAHRQASYTNLPPGNYTLRLKGTNRDGVWNQTSLDMPLRVLPAWYQTIWFRLLLLGGGVLLIVLVVRSRTAYYRRRQQILERQVQLRTTELQSRSDQVKALLDNSGQGFLSFGEDLLIDAEHSSACEAMLGLVPAGMAADLALFSTDEKKAELFRSAAKAFRECADYKRRGVLLSLFPTEIRRGGLMIDIAYRRIGHGRLMAVLTDVTESQRLADKLESNYRRQDMVVAAVIESRDFFEAVDSYRRFIDVELPEVLTREDMPEAMLAEIFRTVHTFKGVLGQFNFERSPKALHDFEEVLTDFATAAGSETVEMLEAATDFPQLRRSLALDLAVVEGMLGSDFIQRGARVAVPTALADSFSRLGERLLAGGSVDLDDPADHDLLRDLSRMHYVGLDRMLHGFDRLVRQLAESQGKAIAPLAVEGGEGIMIDPRRYRDFIQSLVHVFRNAISHGIEKPGRRADFGKDEAGMILCTVTAEAASVTIAIADDGAGLDIDLLRARLADIGQPDDLSDEAVMQSVFTDSVSTQEFPDEVSGRGVGLGAVREAVEALGGVALVSSAPGRGAVFKFILPQGAGISMTEAAEIRGA